MITTYNVVHRFISKKKKNRIIITLGDVSAVKP